MKTEVASIISTFNKIPNQTTVDSEIYINKPPVGIIEACYKMGGKLDNIIAFHSLSKRSNVPGIRSGFAVGDQKIIKKYKKIRQYCAGQQPIPIQEAAIALWNDDKHV